MNFCARYTPLPPPDPNGIVRAGNPPPRGEGKEDVHSFFWRAIGCAVALILGIFLVACTRQPNNLHPLTLVSPVGQRIELHVEVADEPTERERGLMFREKLPTSQGMLFIFDKPHMLSFWMKNTKMPLDILFFDEGGSFVSTVTMTPCTADPCQTYPSDAEAQYALEAPAGFVEQHGVGEGWRGKLPTFPASSVKR